MCAKAARASRAVPSRRTSLRIAFATPELQSLVRKTSLAEVSESLARTLRQEGADIRVFLRAGGRTLTETWTFPWSNKP